MRRRAVRLTAPRSRAYFDAVARARAPPGFSLEKARAVQRELAAKVIREDRFRNPPETVGGVDIAYVGEHTAVGAAVVLDYDTLMVVEEATAVTEVHFPYIPTLLSFRELPPMVRALKKLSKMPDILLVDGHGVSHPYYLGRPDRPG